MDGETTCPGVLRNANPELTHNDNPPNTETYLGWGVIRKRVTLEHDCIRTPLLAKEIRVLTINQVMRCRDDPTWR